MIQLNTSEDMRKLKASLRLRFPVLMANIAQILLYREEFRLANILTAHYELCLTEEIVMTAASSKYFDWLNWVWAFDKNYLGPRRSKYS
jgi:hypothetical protein